MATIVLFKIFGLYFLAIGLAFLLNPTRVKNVYLTMMDNDALLYLGGIVAVLMGATIVSLHNIWVMGLPVIITLIGWLSLMKGTGLLFCSRFAQTFSFMFQKSDLFFRLLGVVLSLFGLFLTYQGWMG